MCVHVPFLKGFNYEHNIIRPFTSKNFKCGNNKSKCRDRSPI